jgi:hypothetical protein
MGFTLASEARIRRTRERTIFNERWAGVKILSLLVLMEWDSGPESTNFHTKRGFK